MQPLIPSHHKLHLHFLWTIHLNFFSYSITLLNICATLYEQFDNSFSCKCFLQWMQQVGPLIVAYKIIPTMQVVICIVANWCWHLWFLSKCWILMLLGMHKGFKFFQLSIELAICFVFLCMWFGLLFVMLAICFTMFFCFTSLPLQLLCSFNHY